MADQKVQEKLNKKKILKMIHEVKEVKEVQKYQCQKLKREQICLLI